MTRIDWRVGVGAVALGLVSVACGSDTPANEVSVGDCTNEELSGSVGEIETVSCDESHTAEVFAKFDLEGDQYPGDDQVRELAREGCLGTRFESYVGIPYERSEFVAGPLPPNEETWTEADDRTVICFAVFDPPREGSIEGLGT